MASNGWKRTLHFLGLVEDYEDEYAEVGVGDPMGAPPLGGEPPAAPRPEPSNVRRIPTAGSMEEAVPPRPASAPAPVAPSGTVNVLGGPSTQPPPARPSGPRVIEHVHVTSPTAFNDVEEVGERFRDGTPVLMNLQGASEPVAKRLLDFASGLIYGLDGSIDRTGDRIFMLTPGDITIADGEMDRLRSRGLVS
ncbi:MAG TPA: cell division protein SepF [Euzebya sp.]|nr:cell division protein SepF [Euzebya sp.]